MNTDIKGNYDEELSHIKYMLLFLTILIRANFHTPRGMQIDLERSTMTQVCDAQSRYEKRCIEIN